MPQMAVEKTDTPEKLWEKFAKFNCIPSKAENPNAYENLRATFMAGFSACFGLVGVCVFQMGDEGWVKMKEIHNCLDEVSKQYGEPPPGHPAHGETSSAA